MNEQITQAITILQQGGIVMYPTDTAFGMGCRMDDEVAVKRLFTIRKRPFTQPTPVLFDTIARVKEYVSSIPTNVENLMHTYWPGALTIILACQPDKVPTLVKKDNTIGTRVPDHSIPQALIKGINVPLLGPSANFHGEQTPFTYEELDPALCKQVDFVIPGVCKPGRVTSTVINCTVAPWHILREGAIAVRSKQ